MTAVMTCTHAHIHVSPRSQDWIVLIDLSTCASAGVHCEPPELCPFPNSFHVDVWVPVEPPTTAKSKEKLRFCLFNLFIFGKGKKVAS